MLPIEISKPKSLTEIEGNRIRGKRREVSLTLSQTGGNRIIQTNHCALSGKQVPVLILLLNKNIFTISEENVVCCSFKTSVFTT